MYGLPKGFTGDFLIGRTLEMICFSQNEIYLHFDNGTAIKIESAFSFKSNELINVPVRQSDLMELIGFVTVGAHGTESGSLIVDFNSGGTLQIYDTSANYESYTITHGSAEIIV